MTILVLNNCGSCITNITWRLLPQSSLVSDHGYLVGHYPLHIPTVFPVKLKDSLKIHLWPNKNEKPQTFAILCLEFGLTLFFFSFWLPPLRRPRGSWRSWRIISSALHITVLISFPSLPPQPTWLHLHPACARTTPLQQPPRAVPASQGPVQLRRWRILLPAPPCRPARLSIQPHPSGLRWPSPPHAALQPVRLHIPAVTTPRRQPW